MMVAVLFARADSVYKTLPHLDVFDAERDARTWPGGCPVVAHPPCRAWGRLRHFAKPRHDEKDLALFAVDAVRAYGGVLEHPEGSSLWTAANLPRPGSGTDLFGGWTLPVSQKWWGHRCEKRTWLYICGIKPGDIPSFPITLGEASHVVATSLRHDPRAARKSIPKAEREHTPLAFAHWLVDLAASRHTGFDFTHLNSSAWRIRRRSATGIYQGVSPC